MSSFLFNVTLIMIHMQCMFPAHITKSTQKLAENVTSRTVIGCRGDLVIHSDVL